MSEESDNGGRKNVELSLERPFEPFTEYQLTTNP